jgi:hypothetical protein
MVVTWYRLPLQDLELLLTSSSSSSRRILLAGDDVTRVMATLPAAAGVCKSDGKDNVIGERVRIPV